MRKSEVGQQKLELELLSSAQGQVCRSEGWEPAGPVRCSPTPSQDPMVSALGAYLSLLIRTLLLGLVLMGVSRAPAATALQSIPTA